MEAVEVNVTTAVPLQAASAAKASAASGADTQRLRTDSRRPLADARQLRTDIRRLRADRAHSTRSANRSFTMARTLMGGEYCGPFYPHEKLGLGKDL